MRMKVVVEFNYFIGDEDGRPPAHYEAATWAEAAQLDAGLFSEDPGLMAGLMADSQHLSVNISYDEG